MPERIYVLKTSFQRKDIANRISGMNLVGLVFQGNEESKIVMMPDAYVLKSDNLEVFCPDDETMCEILDMVDDPKYLDERQKVWLRKSQRIISGKVQQIIWARDSFQCMYCARRMGKVQLTIDHFIPLELGGKDDETNLISACSACNTAKGNMSPEDWCDHKNLDYEFYVRYLRHQNQK